HVASPSLHAALPIFARHRVGRRAAAPPGLPGHVSDRRHSHLLIHRTGSTVALQCSLASLLRRRLLPGSGQVCAAPAHPAFPGTGEPVQRCGTTVALDESDVKTRRNRRYLLVTSPPIAKNAPIDGRKAGK